MHRGKDLVVSQRCHHRRFEQRLGCDTTVAGTADHRHLAPQRKRGQTDFGRRVGIGEAAADRTPVSGLLMTDVGKRLRQQRNGGRDLVAGKDVGLPGGGADDQGIALRSNPLERIDVVDIDQHVGTRHAHRHQRNQRLAARNDFSFLVTRLRQKLADMLDGGRAHIVKSCSFHGFRLPVCSCPFAGRLRASVILAVYIGIRADWVA